MRHPCGLDIVFPGLPDNTLRNTRTMRQHDREKMHTTSSHQPGERFSSCSSECLVLRRFPQALHITHGWDAEEAFVLPIEVGGISVPHAVGWASRSACW
jgi:hypothetical protein